MIYVGIDPGLTGVVAWYDDDTNRFDWFTLPTKLKPGMTKTSKTFVKEQIDASMLKSMLEINLGEYGERISFCVERVGAMGGQGMSTGASLSHTAGMIEGTILGTYEVVNVYESVRPAVWMKELGLHGKKKEKGFNPMKDYVANTLGITKRINKDVADAICIAHYCKLMHQEGV